MIADLRERILNNLGFLGPLGKAVQKWLGQVEAAGSPGATEAKVFLNGTWLGHPLHPALTDLTLGSWTASTLLDLADGGRDGEFGARR